jgi:hypothetical protein
MIHHNSGKSVNFLLLPHHKEEWSQSHPDFIAANVRSLTGEQAFEFVTSKAYIKAAEAAKQYATADVRKINYTYRDLLNCSSWAVSGVDPLANWEPMEWGQIKPDSPRHKADGSTVKYEAPLGEQTRLFLPNVPLTIARLVIDRHNLTATEEKRIQPANIQRLELEYLISENAFWPWFIKNPVIDLAITEGAKKAGAAFSAGFAAVSLPGVWNGRTARLKDEQGRVIPNQPAPKLRAELLALAQPGRRIFFAFDRDEKEKTQRSVWNATESTAFLFLKTTKAKPFLTKWDGKKGKGIDDYIKENGVNAFAEVMASATSYEDWRINNCLSKALVRDADLTIDQKLIDIDLDALPSDGIVAIVSAKGTGKTKNFLIPMAARFERALLIGHLINLTRANSERMGCEYRTDVDRGYGHWINKAGQKIYKISTVVDSLGGFSPKDFAGSIVILDEVCQLIRSVLTSKNIGSRGNRGLILTRLRQILQTAALVVCADADLDDGTLTYLETLRGDDKPAFLIKNEYVPTGYDVTVYESTNASGIQSAAIECYKGELAKGGEGKHVIVPTDSLATCEAIAKMAREIDGAEVIEIDAKTSSGEIERLFAANPDQYLAYLEGDKPAFIIYSPSLGTGSSIETDRIAHVFGIFQGASIIDTDIMQMLGRVRCNAPRSLWVKETGSARNGFCASSKALDIRDALENQANSTAFAVRAQLSEVAYSGMTTFEWESDPHIAQYCEIEANKNAVMPQLRARVLNRVTLEGNRIVSRNNLECKEMKERIQIVKQEIKAAEAKAVAVSPEINEIQAEAISKLENPTPEQQKALTKHHLADFYLDEVTEELVLDDNGGEKRRQISAYEELTDVDLARSRDVAVLENQIKYGAQLSPQDFRKSTVAVLAREALGLKDWIGKTDSWVSGCKELETFKALCLKSELGIKRALNYTVKESMSGQQILADLLRQVGVSCTHKQSRINGKMVRTYSIDAEALEALKGAVGRRQQRRADILAGRCNTPLGLNKNTEGMQQDHREEIPQSNSQAAGQFALIP